MNQAVMIINCYLYGATAVMLLVLLLIVYLRGQVNHFPNPFAKKNLVYRHPAQAKGVLFGNAAQLAGYGAGGGYFRRYFSECQHAQQNCI